jgi:hypothetical protein
MHPLAQLCLAVQGLRHRTLTIVVYLVDALLLYEFPSADAAMGVRTQKYADMHKRRRP